MSSVIVAALLLIVVALTASTVYLYLRLRSLEMDVEDIVDALQEGSEQEQIIVSSSGPHILFS